MKTEQEIRDRIKIIEERIGRSTKRNANKLKQLAETLYWVLGERDIELGEE
jgi:hypothetical protein